MSKVMTNVLKAGAVTVTAVAFGFYCKHLHKVKEEKKDLIEVNKVELDELVSSAKTATEGSLEFRENFDKVFKDLKKNYKRTYSLQSAELALIKEKDVLKKIAELSEESQTALKYYLENLLLQKEVSDLNRKLTNEQIEKAVYQIAYTWLKNQ